MKALLSSLSIAFLMSFVLMGCVAETKEDFEAIIVNKDEKTVTVSTNGHEYRLITTEIDFTAEVGDKVKVWTTGQFEESNPAQGKATKIETINKK